MKFLSQMDLPAAVLVFYSFLQYSLFRKSVSLLFHQRRVRESYTEKMAIEMETEAEQQQQKIDYSECPIDQWTADSNQKEGGITLMIEIQLLFVLLLLVILASCVTVAKQSALQNMGAKSA